MTDIPCFLAGDYGNGTFGVKTSIGLNDVTVLADDNDPDKRSFNSQWTNLCKIKLIGSVSTPWEAFQQRTMTFNNGYYANSTSGWRQTQIAEVPTGLSYIPIWEDRIYDPANKIFYDDYLYGSNPSGYPGSSNSGGRSYFAGLTTSPANTLFLTPWANTAAGVPVSTTASYTDGSTSPPYPAYPTPPAKPSVEPAAVCVIYANKLGDLS